MGEESEAILFRRLFMRPLVHFEIAVSRLFKSVASTSSKYPSSWLNCTRVSSSLMEPFAMNRKRTNSFFDCLAAPSAIFAGTDTDARRSCDINPNFSWSGNLLVARYMHFTSSKLSFHSSNLWWGFMNAINEMVPVAANVAPPVFRTKLRHISRVISHLTSNISPL